MTGLTKEMPLADLSLSIRKYASFAFLRGPKTTKSTATEIGPHLYRPSQMVLSGGEDGSMPTAGRANRTTGYARKGCNSASDGDPAGLPAASRLSRAVLTRCRIPA